MFLRHMIAGVVLAYSTHSYPAERIFNDQFTVNGVPIATRAIISDPFPQSTPIAVEHKSDEGSFDNLYRFTSGPDWRNSTAAMEDKFVSSIDFSILSGSAQRSWVDVGFMIDHGTHAPGAVRTGSFEVTNRVMNDSGSVLAEFTHSGGFGDEGIGGWGFVIPVPAAAGSHFKFEFSTKFSRGLYPSLAQPDCLSLGCPGLVADRYLFTGFAVTSIVPVTSPVPEPATSLLLASGLVLALARRRSARSLARIHDGTTTHCKSAMREMH